jgi:hypothetical protein
MNGENARFGRGCGQLAWTLSRFTPDREHFANATYLLGFDHRFEEALVVVPGPREWAWSAGSRLRVPMRMDFRSDAADRSSAGMSRDVYKRI